MVLSLRIFCLPYLMGLYKVMYFPSVPLFCKSFHSLRRLQNFPQPPDHTKLALCFRWLLVDACSAAHVSLGMESQSHATSLVFLRPAQQLQNSVHDIGIPYLYPLSSMSSYFQPFSSNFQATSSPFQLFPIISTNFESHTGKQHDLGFAALSQKRVRKWCNQKLKAHLCELDFTHHNPYCTTTTS